MTRRRLAEYLAFSILPLACSQPVSRSRPEAPDPPAARVEPSEVTYPWDSRTDDYHWLEDPDDPAVIAYLEAENAYAAAMLAHTEPLQEVLFQEMSERVPEDAVAGLWRAGDFFVYYRMEEGKEYPIYARRRGSLEAEEEILLDVNVLAEGHEYARVPFPVISPDQNLMAFGLDTVGIPRYSTVRFKDLTTGELLPDRIYPAGPQVAWGNDNRTLFYLALDPSGGGPSLYSHLLGTDPAGDRLVVERVTPGLSKIHGYILTASGGSFLYLDADSSEGEFKPFPPPHLGGTQRIKAAGDYFYILTDEDGAGNGKLIRTPVIATARAHWEEVVPHRDDVLLENFEAFRDFLVLQEREDGRVRLRVLPWDGREEYDIRFSEPTYEAYLLEGESEKAVESDLLLYHYSSFTTPNTTYEFNLNTREAQLVAQATIRGGIHPEDYVSERLSAPAPDGASVPVSVLYRRGLEKNGDSPLLLYGYGGATENASYNGALLSLVDRGFVYAIAHVRGGREKGASWEQGGQGLNTRNRFTDFIAVAEYLVQEGYADPKRLFAQGMSSGGLLVGAVANMRPELFRGIVAQVPWVDVLTGFMNQNGPSETGDPREEAHYRYVLSYSPYQNVEGKDYPNLLVTTALRDTQVPYWQPAKWVAKLRALKTDDNVLLLRANLGAGGHAGVSGRYARWREAALLYAFILDQAGMKEPTGDSKKRSQGQRQRVRRPGRE